MLGLIPYSNSLPYGIVQNIKRRARLRTINSYCRDHTAIKILLNNTYRTYSDIYMVFDTFSVGATLCQLSEVASRVHHDLRKEIASRERANSPPKRLKKGVAVSN